MVLHIPEVAIALLRIPMDREEIVLRQLEHQREQDQQLAHNLEVDVSRKELDLGPVLPDHRRVVAVIRRDEFRDVVDLRVVFDARFDLAQSERFVAVVPAVLEVRAVLEFFCLGEVENLFAQAELPVDFVLRQAEVGDVEKSCMQG